MLNFECLIIKGNFLGKYTNSRGNRFLYNPLTNFNLHTAGGVFEGWRLGTINVKWLMVNDLLRKGKISNPTRILGLS